MKNTVIKFGLISGAILVGLFAITLPLCLNGTIDFDNQEILGYSSMVLSFMMVFFGIRSFREQHGGGAISFGRAFKVGILITLVTCAVYVISWEIVYYNFLPDFFETYSSHTLEKMRAKGESAEAIAAMRAQLATWGELYKNPFINVAMTFMEVFPVGLIVTLVSAAILRRKPERGGGPEVATAGA
ncbi:MAG: DUF4199 domain-containing protein [Acidobacteria bacterium]|nr:DUF4199 domain-containing protein [Acidobacteriota bacterium]